jgi:uncharacterized OsmC-like protein
VKISATVRNTGTSHQVDVATAGTAKPLQVPAKRGAPGSDVNGGEFLMLALATCYCNDVYREASRQGIPVGSVEVEATADFEGVGLAAANIRYRARVSSPAGTDRIEALLRATDAVAEVHNTLRAGVPVQLVPWADGE